MELRIKQQKDCCVVVSGEEVKNDPSASGGRGNDGMPGLDHGWVRRRDSLCPMKLTLLTIASGVRCHFPHFRGKENKAQRGEVTCLRSHSQWPNQASKGSLTGLQDLPAADTHLL